MIQGVNHLPVKTFVDDRGYLTQVIQETNSVMPPIKRIYVTGNFANRVIRGFHKHSREWKGFFVASGAAKFVLVDDRKDSPTYKNNEAFVLTPASPSILV
ncbi:MAG: dTDP-4-dehydrorhamnose 3,5-epimerase family protein, partial [Nitrososphaera sp.]